ncbi:Carboxylic ester hydrolase [Tolypocladium paradoxum]|uniref:Carboxylic ester hydrolase n=1 Tax=Tolypocladium paradoxum TaxID=94208 RepID=A0A2S4KMM5_9HYPO|nr:Carboxylic ester hydrolase [Tolypocladium paradoxum]
MSQINHPQLGRVTGTSQDGIAYFRGIKYASLEHAFAAPKVYSERAADGLDATRHGPGATSLSVACDMELGLIQKSLPHGPFTTSSTECLNLNIAVPENAKGPLPVFVFIHGGGFAIGSNAWPQYDLTRIVKLSQDIGKPVVGVQINYRLGVYGFLDSTALREAGVKPNRGLLDQKAAFAWIRDHISGFHGNPDSVTAIGQSAGSSKQLPLEPLV